MGGSDYASCMELLGLEFGLALPIELAVGLRIRARCLQVASVSSSAFRHDHSRSFYVS